jgi:hypothetical protein
MSRSKSFTERLKNMKESIEKNKDLLKKNFPDDVTTTGNPDLVREKNKSNPENHTEGDDDEEARNKKS